jgi:hypothetical protein
MASADPSAPSSLAARLLTAGNPFSDPVVRLEHGVPPPPDVAAIHTAARAALRDAIATVASERRAAMVLITGDPGQGKTHLLAQLRQQATTYTFIDVPPLKDAGAPFAHLLRYVVQGLAVARHLQRLCWDVLRRVAAAVVEDARDDGDDELAERVEQTLVGGDQYVGTFRTMAQQDPGLGALLYQRGRHLAPLNGLYADFGRVLCRMTERDAEPAIIDWLRGAELPPDDLARLGVGHRVDGEAEAFEVLRALAQVASQITRRPLVLCLDQLESIAGLLGGAAVSRLFHALMELYQQAPVCQVLMCQTQQWSELRRDVPAAALERVRLLPPLSKPTADEARAVVASRLAPLWEPAGLTPPYPTWPLPAAFLDELVGRRRPTIRQVLLECDAVIDAMRQAGDVREPDTGAPPPLPPPPPSPAARDAELRAARDRYVRACDDTMPTPGFRQDALRHAVIDVLRGAMALGRRIGGVGLAAVVVPPRPDRGSPAPPVVTVEGPMGMARLAFEVFSDDARMTHKVLQRLAAAVDSGSADLAVLLREAETPLSETARASHDLAAQLAERGGGVVYLDRETALRLLGAERLLTAAASAEVLVGETPITRDDALAFLLDRDDLGVALVPLLSRASTTPPRGPARSA